MSLTAIQLSDFRADIGDTGSSPAFTDDELQRLYTRADDDEALARVYAIRQLIAHAAKFSDYTVGQTSERKSQIFDHLVTRLLPLWEAEAGILGGVLHTGGLDTGTDQDSSTTLNSRLSEWG